MDYYPTEGNAFTSCQLGIIHANFFQVGTTNSRTKDFLDVDWVADDPGSKITINSGENPVWLSTRYLKGDIEIKAGASLTIKCTVGMPNNGIITVDKGGQLIIDGGTITNVNGNSWSGVIAYGDNTLPTDGSAEGNGGNGMVICKNNATIEYADMGIKVQDGAIAQIDQTTFHNCYRSLNITGFYNTTTHSSVSRCTFNCDGFCRGGHSSDFTFIHLQIVEIDGVIVAGNTFQNTATSPNQTTYRGEGIDGYD
jgi:hypothetical protein